MFESVITQIGIADLVGDVPSLKSLVSYHGKVGEAAVIDFLIMSSALPPRELSQWFFL